MKKALTSLITLLICLCGTAQDRSTLQALCDVYNSECPLKLDDGFVIQSAQIEGDNFIFNIFTEFDNSEMGYIEIMKDTMADLLFQEFSSTSDKILNVLCYESKTNIIFRLSNNDGKMSDLLVTWQKIGGEGHADETTDKDRAALAIIVSLMNQECPEDIGDGDVMQSVVLDGNQVIMTMLTDLDDKEIAMIQLFGSVFEDMYLTNEDMAELFALCKVAKCDFVARFVNVQGQHSDIVISYAKM